MPGSSGLGRRHARPRRTPIPSLPPPADARPFPFEDATDRDRASLVRQLGQGGEGLLGIAKRCRHGFPQVHVKAPLYHYPERGHLSAYSTACWLSCPLLRRSIRWMERRGWLQAYEREVRCDPALAEALRAAQSGHAEARRALVPAVWRNRLAQDPSLERQRHVIEETGVAGAVDPDWVKCLHAHVADHYSRGDNPIARDLLQQLRALGIPPEGTDTCHRICDPDAPAPPRPGHLVVDVPATAQEIDAALHEAKGASAHRPPRSST